LEANIIGAVVESSLVVVSVAISAGAVLVNELNILRVDDDSIPALFRGDGGRGTTHVQTGVVGFWVSETVGRRVVPLLAGGQTLHGFTALHHTEVTDVVVFTLRTVAELYTTLGCFARSFLRIQKSPWLA